MTDLETPLVAHAVGIGFADLPPSTVESTRRAVLWTLGSMVAGSRAEGCEPIASFLDDLAGPRTGRATVVGGGSTHGPDLAGFANGSYAKALEYEDKHWMGNSHAYAVATAVVPAAFAVAEHVGGVSGAELIAAVACGLEIEMRMIDGAPHAIDTAFASTYLLGNMGAAAAAAKVLGLDAKATRDAYGLAYAQAAGNYQAQAEGHQALGIRMQMGFCVRTGVHAALMARHGMDGPQRFLGGRYGLYSAFFGECDTDAVLAGLGTHYRADRLGFKNYPCCALNHQALDALRQLRSRIGDPDRIASVTVHGAPFMWKTTQPIEAKQRPTTGVELPWSLPWVAACVLTAGRLSLADMRVEALRDHRRMSLAGKVFAELDAAEDAVHAVVTLDDGRVLESDRVAAPSGHPAHPLSTDDVVARWADVVRFGPDHLTPGRLDTARDLVLRLEKEDDGTAPIRALA